jgi:hypothetical protein
MLFPYHVAAQVRGVLFFGLARGFHRLGCQPLDQQLLNHYATDQENPAAD